MKPFALPAAFAAAALSLATPATAALSVGAKAPDFTTQAAIGGKPFTFALKKALKKGPVVLYFFPAAFTPGCTIEAHEFAEASADFEKEGATLIGLSADPIDKLAKFSVEECRNKFPVGTATPATISGYDVVLPQRTTLVQPHLLRDRARWQDHLCAFGDEPRGPCPGHARRREGVESETLSSSQSELTPSPRESEGALLHRRWAAAGSPLSRR